MSLLNCYLVDIVFFSRSRTQAANPTSFCGDITPSPLTAAFLNDVSHCSEAQFKSKMTLGSNVTCDLLAQHAATFASTSPSDGKTLHSSLEDWLCHLLFLAFLWFISCLLWFLQNFFAFMMSLLFEVISWIYLLIWCQQNNFLRFF